MQLVRKGTKADSGQYEIVELFNFKLRLADNLPKPIKKLFTDMAKKYAAVFTVVDVPAGTEYPAMQRIAPMPTPTMRRPAASMATTTVPSKKTVMKSELKNIKKNSGKK